MRRIVIWLGVLTLVSVIGGYAALYRPDIPYAALEQTYADARSRYVRLPGGVRTHYRDEGVRTGPAVLLLHGFSASLHTWEPCVARLADRYRLVSIDLPGHGLTRAPSDYEASIDRYVREVEALAAALPLPRFALVGSSMGGNVAWEYTLAHPQRVTALVLVDAAGWPDARPGTDPPPALQALRIPVLGPLLRDLDGTRPFRDGLRAAVADPSLVDEPLVRRYVDLARAPGHRDILLQLMLTRSARRAATSALLAGIRVPTLILQGGRDPLVPAEHARLFAAAIPGSEVVIWDDVGHLPMEEQPERSAAVVASFLARALSTPRAAHASPGARHVQPSSKSRRVTGCEGSCARPTSGAGAAG